MPRGTCLSEAEKRRICVYKWKKLSYRDIALKLHRSPTVIANYCRGMDSYGHNSKRQKSIPSSSKKENSPNISSLLSVPPPSQRINQELSANQQQSFASFLNFLAMNKGFAGLQHSFHQSQHGVPFHGIPTNSTSSSVAGSTQMSAGSATSRPLVALLDGRDCTIEMPLLKDIATVAFCDAQSTAEIHEKVLNEAVAALLYHSISLSREDLLKFKALKVVVRIGSGYHNVDVNAATELGIAICNTPMECVEETADTTMLMILNMFRKTFWLSRINQGSNARQSNNVEQLRELAAGCMRIRGSTLGLIGFGRIGVAVAMRARVFGFHVIFYDPYVTTGIEKSLNIERCDTLADLLKRADCVSLHCPLNSETRFLLNTETILKMKYGTFLVNMSAPDLIAASVLLTALKSGHIRAAALERYDSSSFGDSESNFLEAIAQQHNVIYTPHCAWYSDDSSKELRTAAAKEVRRALVGRFPDDLLNCVNKEALMARATSSTLSGLIPNNAAGLQELAAAAFGLNVASSSSDSKVNLAALLSQNGGENTNSTSGLLFPGSGTSKTLNGNGNSHFPKESSASNTGNSLLLSSLNVPALMPSGAADNADVVEQLNSFMSHFGSIPPEALSSLAAISSGTDMNSSNNPLAGPVNNLSYQNFLMSLNPQLFLNTSQSVLGAAPGSSNSRNSTNVASSASFSAPANTFDVTGASLAATSSAAMTTCGGGSGRSSVSQNSAAGSAFEMSSQNRMGPSGSGKRKECSPPLGVISAKISTSSSRSITSSLPTDRQNEDMVSKIEREAGENNEGRSLPSDGITHLNDKTDSGKTKAEGADEYFKPHNENDAPVDSGNLTSQFVDVATHQDIE